VHLLPVPIIASETIMVDSGFQRFTFRNHYFGAYYRLLTLARLRLGEFYLSCRKAAI
jgi:hypothetical protein